MSISVDTATGTVTIRDGYDINGNAIAEYDANGNLLPSVRDALFIQMAIDRASAATARVSLMQLALQAQNDKIGVINGLMTKLLTGAPSDPAKQASTVTLNPVLTDDEAAFLNSAKTLDQAGNALSTYFSPAPSSGDKSLTLAAGKSYNDLQSAIKSQLNDATNLNQQTMVQYQSLINQRNQMTEWVGNLITMLMSAATGTVANLR